MAGFLGRGRAVGNRDPIIRGTDWEYVGRGKIALVGPAARSGRMLKRDWRCGVPTKELEETTSRETWNVKFCGKWKVGESVGTYIHVSAGCHENTHGVTKQKKTRKKNMKPAIYSYVERIKIGRVVWRMHHHQKQRKTNRKLRFFLSL